MLRIKEFLVLGRMAYECLMAIPIILPVRFFVTGAPIDAISYHILNPIKIEGDRLYIASTGSFSQPQINIIQHLIDIYKPKKVILGKDNDPAGKKFNLALLGQLDSSNENPVDVSFQKNSAEAILTVECLKHGALTIVR